MSTRPALSESGPSVCWERRESADCGLSQSPEDVAFRVLAAQQQPDHATIARFVERHEHAIAGLFGEVLTLCARSGLAKAGVIAVDGTKVAANASRNENRDYEQLA